MTITSTSNIIWHRELPSIRLDGPIATAPEVKGILWYPDSHILPAVASQSLMG